MTDKSNKQLSTDPYKGVRDFYPEDQAIQNYIFATWRKAVESFGYNEYNTSILEPAELYRAKSGEEIVNEQTYTFTDRGEREVTLRPEMTPSVARLVAAKKRELSFPLRWYSIQNFFRYERPQRGRVREFWQLNCDMFGVDSTSADVEVIQLAYNIMKSFGARDGDFKIYINNAKLFRENINGKLLDTELFPKAKKLIDSIQKISKEEFDVEWSKISNQQFDRSIAANTEIETILSQLKMLGIENVEYNPILTRGFDYYTGTVFEVYDTNPENRRALFGGGRFDDLLSLFGGEKVPAVGFGMGDVTMRDFLEVRGLLPQFTSPAQLYIVNAGVSAEQLLTRATEIREKGIRVATDLTTRKIGDQIKKAVKDAVEFVVVLGENEITSGEVSIKHLASEKEEKVRIAEIADYIKGF
ncbi:MAG: histidyl-tRNA synthetase, histidyl-tRNA synthetase [Candidatus Parcubacteria bacterium]|jgi:histidyl-tRNA synthetase